LAVDGLLEYRIILSLVKTIQDGTSIAVQYPGVRWNNEMDDATLEEWVTISPLSFDMTTQRAGKLQTNFLFQISCFSKFAKYRTVKKVHRPWEMAGEIREILDQGSICIQDYDNPSPAEIGCMQVRELGAVYLPEQAPGIPGQNPPEGETTTEVHAVALSFDGFLFKD